MRAPKNHRVVRVLSALAASAVTSLTVPAFAAEEWPPRTPPRVPSDAPSVATPPAEPPAVVTPLPPAPPPAEVEVKPAASPPPVEQPSPAAPESTEIVRVAPEAPSRFGPRYGLSGDRLFVRPPGDEVVLFPGGLVQLDGHSFKTDDIAVPNTGLWLKRARPEVAGWLGRAVYFNAAIDFANGPSLRGVDDYVAFAPARDNVILQAGQFDAPFTFENQTRDRELDFMERSNPVRAFAIPENKKRGVMIQGTPDDRNYYYAAGAFIGDGQKDLMARAWVAPFSFRDPDVLHAVTVGGSAWIGSANSSATLHPQMTSGSVTVLEPSTTWADGDTLTAVALRPAGRNEAVALELNAPLWHRTGVRFEWIAKHEPLAETTAVNGGLPESRNGFLLSGTAAYGEAWYWILGRDRLAGTPGLVLPVRLTQPFGLLPPVVGVMLAARLERIDETMAEPPGVNASADVSSLGSTRVTTARLGLNVWFAGRARVTFDYAFNRLSGTTVYSTSFTDPNIQELSVRLSLAL